MQGYKKYNRKDVRLEIGKTATELRHALSCLERASEFDIVNDLHARNSWKLPV